MMIKLTIFIAISTCVFIACNTTSDSPTFEINKNMVYNTDCDFILYSTNESDFFSPTVLYSPFSAHTIKMPLKLMPNMNYYVRDASCDCRFAILVAEKLRENKYDIILYNLETDSSHNITDGINSTFTDPYFLNRDTLLFLKDGELHAYGMEHKDWAYFPYEHKFLHLFKGNGDLIFLQDSKSSIWEFNMEHKNFTKIWDAPSMFASSRKAKIQGDQLYFISDHENGFNTIYKITLNNPIEEQVVSGDHDYFLANNSFFIRDTLTYIKNKGLQFISNVEKLPKDGVIYDFVSRNDSILMLYADPQHPASLYLLSDTGLINILHQFDRVLDYDIIVDDNGPGVDNLLFLPKDSVRHWVVWLHGGPHEQVSLRFNPYIYNLVLNDVGVIALNFPGSTGKGNDAELLHIPVRDRMAVQLEAIHEDLTIISQKHHIDSFSLIGVSYGSILAHKLAESNDFNIRKIIDFSGINTNEKLPEPSIKTLYIMGDRDFMRSNRQRVRLLDEHKKAGAKTLVLNNEGHSISRSQHISKINGEIISFLRGK